MPVPALLYRAIRLTNMVVFATAVALLLDHSAAAARAAPTGPVHWEAGSRHVTIVDRTGDAAWQRATRRAVERWSEAAAGSGVTLGWEAGTGPCRADGARVPVCRTAQSELGEQPSEGREGLTRTASVRGHSVAAVILVCGDCYMDDARMRVVAAHEVGHALGLSHAARAGSAMFPTGSGEAPDRGDVEALRRLYHHTDQLPRCAYFNLRLGGFCV